MVAIPNAFIAGAAAIAALNPRAGGSCSLANYKPAFPAGQTTLVAPAQAPKFVGLAFGVQNYTCSDASTYTYVCSSFSALHPLVWGWMSL